MGKIQKGVYRHYKGKEYRVLGTARHSETLEPVVIYQALYPSKRFGKNAIWVRPEKMFKESIRVDGKKIPRFKIIRATEKRIKSNKKK